MQAPTFLKRDDVAEAELLMRSFGRAAGLEAAERAESSRNIGNALQFCRWRHQAEPHARACLARGMKIVLT